MLWAISCYFNPLGYQSKKRNYDRFRAHLAVPLVTVELAYDQGFALGPDDADRLIQLQGGALLWQKERLLNIALKALPHDCTAVAWLDADILFENPDWPRQTLAALEHHSFAQPFYEQVDLSDGQPAGEATSLQPSSRSFAAAHALGEVPPAYFAACGLSQSLALAPGRAWAGRRDILQRTGFYDAMILGGGDRAMLSAMVGETESFIAAYRLTPAHAMHYRVWATGLHHQVRSGPEAGIGSVEGRLTHLWHGSLSGRAYGDRPSLLATCDFDPYRDIAHRGHSVWHWASDKPGLHAAVRRYFASRREDGEAVTVAS